MTDAMTPAQAAATEHVLTEESGAREHIVASLCGAHAYGFASADSDVDLKCVHISPTVAFLGLSEPNPTAERLEFVDGVEIDYTSNEIAVALRGVISGGGNMIERLVDPAPLSASSEQADLRTLILSNLSKRIFRHYRGFAHSQRRGIDSDTPKLKKVLYVLRTTLTGVHALETGEIVPDLSELAGEYGFDEATDLITAKRDAELGLVPDLLRPSIAGLVARAFARLDEAHERSTLPDAPANPEALDQWLIEARRTRL